MKRDYWEKVISGMQPKQPSYDGWLDKYFINLRDTRMQIIELGCGWGDDTSFLSKTGFEITSCDFSEESINIIRNLYPNVKTINCDLLAGLPFTKGSANIIIADLCLHYFTYYDTKMIIQEINRVLLPEGLLLCRVNSIKDTNYGVGQGIEVEKNLFLTDKGLKRFSDKEAIIDIFGNWQVQNLCEYILYKYSRPKMVWEIALYK